jgi:diacylglycerol kinase (ATP)
MPLRRFFESANYAINGIFHAAKTQPHMRYHLYAAILILLLSFVLGISLSDFIVIAILVIIVLSAEMLNTAIEATVDIIFKEYDKRAKIIKDIAAGAVLITALGAAIIGYIILFQPLENVFKSGLSIAKHTEEDVAVVAVVVVLMLVIITKTFFGRGLPLRGGMPSGHTAVAFSIWIAVTFLSESFVPSFLVLIMAIFIAQGRVSVGVHNPWEVVLGALVGTTVTFLLFKVFS